VNGRVRDIVIIAHKSKLRRVAEAHLREAISRVKEVDVMLKAHPSLVLLEHQSDVEEALRRIRSAMKGFEEDP